MISSVKKRGVVHLTRYYRPVVGGVETHVRQLAEAQAKFRRVTVLCSGCWKEDRYTVEEGVRVTYTGLTARVANAPVSLRLPMHIARVPQESILHLHTPHPGGVLALLGLGRGINRRRLVVSYHTDILRYPLLYSLYRPLQSLVMSHAGAIVTSSWALKRTSEALREQQGKCYVVPYGVDLQSNMDTGLFDVPRDIDRIVRGCRGRLVLFVGRLVGYKGLPHLIDAIRGVDCHLLIVGDGPLRDRLKPLPPNVTLAGEVQTSLLPFLYRCARVLVLPSCTRAEAFGIVQIEAMANGTPVISTDVGTGVAEVNTHGVTGLVVPPGDSGALRSAIKVIVEDTQLRNELGRNARTKVNTNYSRDAMLNKIEEVYRSLERPGCCLGGAGLHQP